VLLTYPLRHEIAVGFCHNPPSAACCVHRQRRGIPACGPALQGLGVGQLWRQRAAIRDLQEQRRRRSRGVRTALSGRASGHSDWAFNQRSRNDSWAWAGEPRFLASSCRFSGTSDVSLVSDWCVCWGGGAAKDVQVAQRLSDCGAGISRKMLDMSGRTRARAQGGGGGGVRGPATGSSTRAPSPPPQKHTHTYTDTHSTGRQGQKTQTQTQTQTRHRHKHRHKPRHIKDTSSTEDRHPS